MKRAYKIFSLALIFICCSLITCATKYDNDTDLTFSFKHRDSTGKVYFNDESIDAKKVAIVVMDAWDYHWCRSWRNRAGSLIPRMNKTLEGARKLGITIIFSPTNAMPDMHNTKQRKATFQTPFHQIPQSLGLIKEGTSPFLTGNCECGYGHACYLTHNVNNQNPDLKMDDQDYIGVTLQEVYNMLAEKEITRVILAGFATNVCVWDKPAGLKNSVNAGFKCSIASDLTEAITQYSEDIFYPTDGTLQALALIEQNFAPSVVMEELLKNEGVWEDKLILDYAHIIPWDKFFGHATTTHPIQVEINCRFHPNAAFRYTMDGTKPTFSSQLYEEPIKISEFCQLKTAGFIGEKQVTRITKAAYWKFPEIPELPHLYISDIKSSRELICEVKPGSYALAKSAKFDKSVDGNSLSNRGLKFPKDIGVQSKNEITYSNNANYKKFVALAAVDDECSQWDNPGGLQRWPQWEKPLTEPTSYRISKIILEVYIDGKLMAYTPTLNNGDVPWRIEVEIPEGGKEITLAVKDDETFLVIAMEMAIGSMQDF